MHTFAWAIEKNAEKFELKIDTKLMFEKLSYPRAPTIGKRRVSWCSSSFFKYILLDET